MIVAGKVHESEFVALGRFFLLPEFKADFLVELDGSGGVGDANAGVEKLNHGAKSGGKWAVCEVWSCGTAGEALEIPHLEIV